MKRSNIPADDTPLDLGDIEPGGAPGDREAPEGHHPWSPSELDKFMRKPRHHPECDCLDCNPQR